MGEEGRGFDVEALIWKELGGEERACAWQEDSAILVDASGLAELTITGHPLTYADSDGREIEQPASFLDWRGYFGTNTLSSQGSEEFQPDENDPDTSV